MSNLPIVAIPCNRAELQGAPTHFVRHSYVKALLEITKCVPLLIPAIGIDDHAKLRTLVYQAIVD